MTIKPATPLPWFMGAHFNDAPGSYSRRNIYGLDERHIARIVADDSRAENAAYIVHACNNYPRLVEALRHFEHDPVDDAAMKLLRELGEL